MLLPLLRSRNIFTIPNATKSTTTTTTKNPGCCLLSIAAQFICLLAATVGSYTLKKKVILNCLPKNPPQIEGQRKCPDKRLHCARAQSKHVSEMEEYWRVYLTTSNPVSHPPCTQVQHNPARCSSSTLRSRSNADNVNTSLPQYTHSHTATMAQNDVKNSALLCDVFFHPFLIPPRPPTRFTLNLEDKNALVIGGWGLERGEQSLRDSQNSSSVYVYVGGNNNRAYCARSSRPFVYSKGFCTRRFANFASQRRLARPHE